MTRESARSAKTNDGTTRRVRRESPGTTYKRTLSKIRHLAEKEQKKLPPGRRTDIHKGRFLKDPRLLDLPLGKPTLRDLTQEVLRIWMTYDNEKQTFTENEGLPSVLTTKDKKGKKWVWIRGARFWFWMIYTQYHRHRATTIDDLDDL